MKLNKPLDSSVKLYGSSTTFDADSGEAMLPVHIDDSGHFSLTITIHSVPFYYNIEVDTRVEVISDPDNLNLTIESVVFVEWRFDEDYSMILGQEEMFIASVLNDIRLGEDVYADDVIVYQGE